MIFAEHHQRIVAILIDYFFLYIVFFLLGKILPDSTFIKLISFLMKNFYFIFLHFGRGQTLGKKVMKIKVVDISGSSLKFKQAMLREIIIFLYYFVLIIFALILGIELSELSQLTIGKGITFIFGLVGLGDVISFLTDEKNQSLHDKIARTVVIKI